MTGRGLRWGILATGGIADAFASDLRTAGLDLRAVGSRSGESAERFARKHGIERAHGSYEALAADPGIDAIYIATPHPQHVENAELALSNGKHVLIEKAFTINQQEAARVRDLANERGLVALEAMWTRYLPHMRRIRSLIADGALGEVRALIADHTQDLPDDPAHRLNDLALGGGALLDLGIYPISFAWDLFGAPETITASATLKATGADAQVQASFTYPGGRMASTFSSSIAQGANTAVVLGDDARIEIDRVWYTPTTFRLVARDGRVLEDYASEVDGRGMQFEAFELERAVREGTSPSDILSIDESVAIMGTLDEIRRQIGVRYPGES